MSEPAWWTRKPEAGTIQAPDVPRIVGTDPHGTDPHETDPHEGVTLVLREQGPAQVTPPAPPPIAPDRPPSRRPSRSAVTALAAAAAIAVGSTVAVLLPGDGPTRPAAGTTPAAAAPIDPATVTATASSTQDPEGGTTYTAANTLDGDPATAWNSNGAPRGRGRPVSLTYTFAQPVDLRDVVVRNGYQKVRPRPGRATVDLYPANARVRRLRVVTDGGAWTWDLADLRAPQTFAGAAGRTGSVRLEVVSVYPSATYPDVAISEVAFTAVPTTPTTSPTTAR